MRAKMWKQYLVYAGQNMAAIPCICGLEYGSNTLYMRARIWKQYLVYAGQNVESPKGEEDVLVLVAAAVQGAADLSEGSLQQAHRVVGPCSLAYHTKTEYRSKKMQNFDF